MSRDFSSLGCEILRMFGFFGCNWLWSMATQLLSTAYDPWPYRSVTPPLDLETLQHVFATSDPPMRHALGTSNIDKAEVTRVNHVD